MKINQSTSAPAAAILMYHNITGGGGSVSVDTDPVYAVSLHQFQKQMALLDSGRYHVASLARFTTCQSQIGSLPHRTIVITFDDGHRSDFECALPVLRQYGFAAEFFLTVEHLGRPGYLTWLEARTLVESGMSIGSHLVHHLYLDDLDAVETERELVNSRSMLSGELGVSVDYLAPPGGRITASAIALANKAGYQGICTSRFGVNKVGSDPFQLRRIPVVAATSTDTFRQLVDQDPFVLRRQSTRLAVLDLAKLILGNRRYDRVRAKLLARRHAGY